MGGWRADLDDEDDADGSLAVVAHALVEPSNADAVLPSCDAGRLAPCLWCMGEWIGKEVLVVDGLERLNLGLLKLKWGRRGGGHGPQGRRKDDDGGEDQMSTPSREMGSRVEDERKQGGGGW